MSAKDGFEGEILDLLFLNTPIAGIGDSNGILGSVSAGSFNIALYKVAPDDASQGTECDYAGYARASVVRNASGFTRSGNNISNSAAVLFPQCVSGTMQQAVSFTINKGSTPGVNDAIIWGMNYLGGTLTPLDISTGITPRFDIGDLDINVD